jgi:hypothetical protein
LPRPLRRDRWAGHRSWGPSEVTISAVQASNQSRQLFARRVQTGLPSRRRMCVIVRPLPCSSRYRSQRLC